MRHAPLGPSLRTASGRVALALLLVGGVAPAGCERTPAASEPLAAGEAPQEAKQLWTCGMHPQVIQDHPGTCPICGMALTPLKERGEAGGADGKTVIIDPVIVQNMGVRVARVGEGPLRMTIRAVGYLEEAEPNRYDVNLRVSGWVERLYADTEGMHLERGSPLFDLYSPELTQGIGELIAARRARESLPPGGSESTRTSTDALYEAAERKLRLWGLSAAQIRELATRQEAPATVTFSSPVGGHLMEKKIVAGAAVEAGKRVLRIVDHSVLWLDARVFEQDLAYVRLGQPASATVPAEPGRRFSGEVTFLHPHVEPMARTALVRIALVNPELTLRPGMYATVEIDAELAPSALLVPREAVIDTGTRQIAFVTADGRHFEPRRLSLGVESGDGRVQVLDGLAAGDTVVVSGQFLIDAESRLQEAIDKHLRDRLLIRSGEAPAESVEVTPPSRDAEDGHGTHRH